MATGRRTPHLLRSALTILLAGSGTVRRLVRAQSQFICGDSYDDARTNCSTSPKCPTGEGCLPEQKCFSIPDSQCVTLKPTQSPVGEPTGFPTPEPFRICALSYDEAVAACRIGPECPGGDDTSPCEDGAACFSVPAELCPSFAPTAEPTRIPRACGADGFAAQANCGDESKRCDTVDDCDGGEACFSIPADVCGVDPDIGGSSGGGSDSSGSLTFGNQGQGQGDNGMGMGNGQDIDPSAPIDIGGGGAIEPVMFDEGSSAMADDTEDDASPSPTASFRMVCGTNYTDASSNCRTNPLCPTGDGCPPDKEQCFAIPISACPKPPEESPTSVPTAPGPVAVQGGSSSGPSPDDGGGGSASGEGTASPSLAPAAAATPATEGPSTSSPAEIEAPTAPTERPTPAFLMVCGETYQDAAENVCGNPKCPSGEGCGGGGCFAFAYQDCNAKDEEEEEEDDSSFGPPTPFPVAGGADATTPTTGTPTYNPTDIPSESPSTGAPTQSPIYNRYFCGIDWLAAEENCMSAEPCPPPISQCSNPNESCFQIAPEKCLSMAPTDGPTGPGPRPSASPTASTAPSDVPTGSKFPSFAPTAAPTESPVVNENFCGDDYGQAMQGCSRETACPAGSCPSGLTCFAGIVCPATTETGGGPPVDTPGGPPMGTDDPTSAPYSLAMGGNETSDGGVEEGDDSGTGTPTASPVTWLEALGLGGDGGMTPGSQGQQPERYCGSTMLDARQNCAMRTPCPTGMSDICPDGMSCFPIQGVCGVEGGAVPGGPNLNPPAPAPFGQQDPTVYYPTVPPVESGPAFDPTSPYFCGANYTDASDYCYERTPCPSGYKDGVCPDDEECYPVTMCETPPPTMSAPGESAGGGELTQPTTPLPTEKPTTARPTWGDLMPEDGWNSRASMNDGATGMKSIVLGTIMVMGALLVL